MYAPRANSSNCEPEPGANRPTATEKNSQEREGRGLQSKRPAEFSAEMLKDQELLVSTLSQQGVSEALIRRQFNKLLEEQSKQLARQREEPEPRRTSATTSLLKQRLKRDQQDSRSRNNGLQDLVTAARIVDKSKSSGTSAVGQRCRLNGAQDSGAPEAEAFCRAHSLRQATEQSAARRNVSANGLENSRRQAAAAAAAAAAARPSGEATRHSSGGGDHPACCSAAAEDAHAIADNNHDSGKSSQLAAPPHQFPDIQEPRVFGGFTYFARKPHAVPQLACKPRAHPLPPSASGPPPQLSAVHPDECQRKSVCAS